MLRKRLTVRCPKCDFTASDVLFAPTYGFVECHCPECGYVIDLVKESGISHTLPMFDTPEGETNDRDTC